MGGLLQLQSLFFSLFLVFLFVSKGISQEGTYYVNKESATSSASEYYKDEKKEGSKSLGYYKDEAKRGWWWYEEFVKKEEEKKKEKTKEVKKEAQKEEAKKEAPKKEEDVIRPLYEYSYEELLRMPIDKFKRIYEYYENLAVSNPTEENLYYYYNILDVARKRALLFTMQSMYVWQKYPELSTARDVPTVLPGLYAKQEAMGQEVDSYVGGKRWDYGLIVFVSERCPYCKAQLSIIRTFVENYGWEVKVVDIDYDKRAVSVFGIEVTPSIILVSKRTGEWFPLSSGVISMAEIKERIYLAVRRLEGDLQPEKWGLYRFQEGTSLDPLKPSPLWDKESKNKPENLLQKEGR
jgi:conjugal transfer pilus assembly protein TraF